MNHLVTILEFSIVLSDPNELISPRSPRQMSNAVP